MHLKKKIDTHLSIDFTNSSLVSFPFLEGRNILENILDMDLAALEAICRGGDDCIILFDFAAAFPSLGHEYMWAALEAMGIPGRLLQGLRDS